MAENKSLSSVLEDDFDEINIIFYCNFRKIDYKKFKININYHQNWCMYVDLLYDWYTFGMVYAFTG